MCQSVEKAERERERESKSVQKTVIERTNIYTQRDKDVRDVNMVQSTGLGVEGGERLLFVLESGDLLPSSHFSSRHKPSFTLALFQPALCFSLLFRTRLR